jgi:hypothetical protein
MTQPGTGSSGAGAKFGNPPTVICRSAMAPRVAAP